MVTFLSNLVAERNKYTVNRLSKQIKFKKEKSTQSTTMRTTTCEFTWCNTFCF